VPCRLMGIGPTRNRIPPVGSGLRRTITSNESQPKMSTKLFVGNLSFNLTEQDLREAFAPFGTVTDVAVMLDRATNRPRGFAFVSMSSKEEADKAIQGLNGKALDGRALTVNEARPREDRPTGDRGARRPYSR
jgi:RNA recognition motif-containing protein